MPFRSVPSGTARITLLPTLEHTMNYQFSRFLPLFALVALLAVPQVYAQDAPAPAPQEQVEYSDEELRAFANAYVDVEDLQANYQPQIEAAEAPEEAEALQQQFQAEVDETIVTHGLNAESYDAIVQATQTDPDFSEQVLALIQEVREERMDG